MTDEEDMAVFLLLVRWLAGMSDAQDKEATTHTANVQTTKPRTKH
jgi:hypothetical protein